MSSPFISVVICTRNRVEHIGDMLDTLVAMDKPKRVTWELIVVDNGSDDGTADVVNSFKDSLPLTLITESKAGLSFARNCGVKNAKGKYIIWTDDDVRVHKDWLLSYLKVFQEYPEAEYFGGKIVPVFLGETPAWLLNNLDLLGGAFAERDLGDTLRELSDQKSDLPYGANFAVRADIQKKYHYETYLGVSPNFKRVGEETHLIRKLKFAGGTGMWVPDAKVNHIIPYKRQTKEYLIGYRRSVGETWAVLSEKGDSNSMVKKIDLNKSTFLGVPLWIWKKTIKFGFRYHIKKHISSPRIWLRELLAYGYYRGAFAYLFKLKI